MTGSDNDEVSTFKDQTKPEYKISIIRGGLLAGKH